MPRVWVGDERTRALCRLVARRRQLVRRHMRLGHLSLKVTTDIYGHWERAERKLQAAKMEGAFPI